MGKEALSAANDFVYTYDEQGHVLEECYVEPGPPSGPAGCNPWNSQFFIWLGDIPVGAALEWYTVNSNGDITGSNFKVFYVHADALGTPRVLTDSQDPHNAPVWRWDSEPFGVGGQNGDPNSTGVSYAFDLRFPGQIYDAESGLHYDYFRDYNPTLGRYVESDPIGLDGGSPSTYAYANSNPVTFADPDGLFAPSPGFVTPVGAVAAEAAAEGAEVGAEAGTLVEPGGGTAAGAVAGAVIGGAIGVGVSIYQACKDPDECAKLYAKIDDAVNRLKRRYYQLLENKLNLLPSGPFSVGTHQSQYSNEQLGLRRLLYRAMSKGCLAYNPDAWTWATRPTPSPLPQPTAK